MSTAFQNSFEEIVYKGYSPAQQEEGEVAAVKRRCPRRPVVFVLAIALGMSKFSILILFIFLTSNI
jgi:hypothetical protein